MDSCVAVPGSQTQNRASSDSSPEREHPTAVPIVRADNNRLKTAQRAFAVGPLLEGTERQRVTRFELRKAKEQTLRASYI